ncbi:caspase family protein [Streptomyces kronopolitis]|uniref:caspase family protein n=1 Tax=Streptomyces kronopolitis TaxID=1612435 RepID=UPI003673728E
MSTLWLNEESGPAIHVLVIGVGRYDYFSGGDEHSARTGTMAKEMGQLTTPPASAYEVCVTLLKELRGRPGRALGSIEAVISAQDPQFPAGFPDLFPDADESFGSSAAMHDVQEAFERWYERCDSDQGNVALFYFCGHGIQLGAYGAHALLLQDTRADRFAPFDGSVDLPGTIQNMQGNRAGIQCFFVDACRMSQDLDHKLRALNSRALGPALQTSHDPEQLLVYSTGPGAPAQGRAGESTLFTQCFLKALFSPEHRPDGNGWQVTTTSIGRDIDRLMQWPGLRSSDAPEQQCVTSSTNARGGVLLRFADRPQVSFHFNTAPADALADAAWSLADLRGNRVASRVPGPEPWVDAGPAGEGDLHVAFANGPYSTTSQQVWLLPPCFHHTVHVDAS